MTEKLVGERKMMRIYIGESDIVEQGQYEGKPLWKAILEDFRIRELAGATVHRAIAGFGANARMRTSLTENLSFDQPIIIEVVDTEEKLQGILADLDLLMDSGLITLESVQVTLYRTSKEKKR